MEKKFNVICFANIDWGFIHQRHQHIMNTFAELDCVNKIIYVETLGVRTVKFNAEDFTRIIKKIYNFFSKKEFNSEYMNPKITIMTPLAIPIFSSLFFYINEKFLEKKLNKEISKLNIDLENTIAWVNLSHPAVYEYITKKKFKKIVYDCIDDTKSIPEINNSIVKCEELLIRYADIVYATSMGLYDKCSRLTDKVALLPNGVKKEFIVRKAANLTKGRKKVVGYIGTIYKWFDDDLLYKCVKIHPEIDFCIVGPIRINIDRFKKFNNISFKGKVNHEIIEDYLDKFDVCLIPFKINELTLNANPVKVFEYFSKGKPVVSTDILDSKVYKDIMYIAKDASDFIKKLDEALMEDDEDVYNKRVSFAKMNTWDKRIQDILYHLSI